MDETQIDNLVNYLYDQYATEDSETCTIIVDLLNDMRKQLKEINQER